MASINIFPYCSPDEEYELEWLEGYHGFNLEEQENELDFFSRINTAVETSFRKALKEMEFILDDIQLKEIHLMCDYTNMLSTGGGAANWWVQRSKTEKGHYLLIASPKMINACLMMMDNPDLKPGRDITYAWQHELIRLVDQEQVLRAEKWRDFGSDKMVLRKYLAEFREEGIAELYAAAMGEASIQTIGQAREAFLADTNRVALIDKTTFTKRKEYGKEVIRTAAIYAAGPMMILHALSQHEDEDKVIAGLAGITAEIIGREGQQNQEAIFMLIKAAVKIDPTQFMELLEKPGFDGQPFTNLEELAKIIQFNNTDQHADISHTS